LIHVVPDLATIVIPGFGDAAAPLYSPQKILASQSEGFDRVVSPVRALFERDGDVCRAANAPGDAIADYARHHGLDLLVMGSHGHGPLMSVVLGSVATRVAARCKTPLPICEKR